MKLHQILKDENFAKARVLSYHRQLNQTVASVMILEAADIEKWGSKNQLILTSYYALINLNEDELFNFFKKMAEIEISGIVFKVQRLVEEVPLQLIQYCNMFDIPLIEIPSDVKYEKIILAVLQPIINENSKILNAYYNARKTINQLSLKDLSFNDLIQSFKDLLKNDVQLESESKSTFYTTKSNGKNYKVISSKMLPKINFMENQYYEKVIEYSDNSQAHIVSVDIPDILDQKYVFSVFERFENFNENDIMLIENVTELILTEFLKIYAIKKNQSVRKNNQMHDLLLARYYSLEERDTILNILNIDKYPYYQGVMVSLYGENFRDSNPIRSPLDHVVKYVSSKFTDFSYFQKNYDVIFLFNISKPSDRIKDNDLSAVIDIYKKLNNQWICHIGISTLQKETLDQINDNLLNLKNFMKVIHNKSIILEHDKLGFFKMFYKIQSNEDLYDYVPKTLLDLIEDKPDYALTFSRFLDNNHNYVKTAECLYVHPKTVRYRIDKVIDRLNVSLDDTDALLSMQVALKICEYTGIMKLVNSHS